MPVYKYKALKDDGSPATGIVDADSPREARLKLRGRKILVTEMEAIGAQAEAGQGVGGLARTVGRVFRRRKLGELVIVTRQLGTLLNAGIPLVEALGAVIEQAETQSLESALRDIREKVQQGATFADALGQHRYYFNDLYVNMVKAGEASGTVDKVLDRIADFLQAQNRVQGKVVAALTYPLVMMVIGGGVVVFLLSYVVPKITEILIKQKKALPAPTEFLIFLSEFLKHYWWALGAALLVGAVMFRGFVATEKGKYAWHAFLLKVPVVGTLFKKAAISRFAVTFATLLESGLPALEALGVVKNIVGNKVMEGVLENVRTKITEGADLATPLKASKVFPPVVGYMIAVGEESGKLEELLRKVAEAYDEEIELAAQKVTALLEPVMIVSLAVIVGFIVLAILLPILEISNVGSGGH